MNNTFDEIWEVLQNAKNILIPLHVSPDPDSFGSAIASAKLLKNLGKNTTVISCDESPRVATLESLHDVLREDPAKHNLESYDVLLIQDLNNYLRISREDFVIPESCIVINIDHHPDNRYFGQYNYVDLEAHSTAEILYELYTNQNVAITYEAALSLFFGIVSDTGWFAYSVSPKTLKIAGELVEYGIDTRSVQYELSTLTYKQLKYYGIIYSNTQIDEELNFAYSLVTHDMLVELGIDGKDRQATIGDLTKIYKYIVEPKIKFGIVIKESDPGVFKASLRTQESGEFDVSKVASMVTEKGGGHKMSSGFMMEANNIEEVLERVREVVKSL